MIRYEKFLHEMNNNERRMVKFRVEPKGQKGGQTTQTHFTIGEANLRVFIIKSKHNLHETAKLFRIYVYVCFRRNHFLLSVYSYCFSILFSMSVRQSVCLSVCPLLLGGQRLNSEQCMSSIQTC